MPRRRNGKHAILSSPAAMVARGSTERTNDDEDRTTTASTLTQLTEDEIGAVGGGVGPLFGLAVFVGILLLAGTCAKCN